MKLKEYIQRKAHSLAYKVVKDPAHALEVGVLIKACADCNRGDCGACVYKQEFERLVNLRTCNDCELYPVCNYRPKPGETIRINCFSWIPKGPEDLEGTCSKENE